MLSYFKVALYTLILSTCILASIPWLTTAPVTAASIYDEQVMNQAIEFAEMLENRFKNRENYQLGSEQKADTATREGLFSWMHTVVRAAGVADSQIQQQAFRNYYTGFGEKYSGINMIVTLSGESERKQIVVGTHYDGTGFGDNGSGVAFMLSLIVALAQQTLPYDVKFVFFDAEELGTVGSKYFVKKMSFAEKNRTLMMINIDAIAFGDYPTLYGGVYNKSTNNVEQTEAYDLAVLLARRNQIEVLTTADLDGYYREHQAGPEVKEWTLYSNPWTQENPAPNQQVGGQPYVSPATGLWGDQMYFIEQGIPYLALEATNWFAYDPDNPGQGFDGYTDTNRTDIGRKGAFINTEFDTMDNMYAYFPERLDDHFLVFGQLVTELLIHPDDTFKRKLNLTPLVVKVSITITVLVLLGLLIRCRYGRKK